MKKLFAFALTIVALVLGSCSKGDQNLLRAVPDDTEVLARIDLKATARSVGYTWSDVIKRAVSSFGLEDGDNGIDMSGTAYVFVTEGARLSGVVLPVKDADDLRDFLTKNGQAVSETDGVYSVGGSLAFDKERLVVAYGDAASGFGLHSLLKQTTVEDDIEELNSQLDDIDDPIAIVVDGDIVKKQAALDLSTTMVLASLPIDLDDIYLRVGIDATENTAVISTSIVGEDSEAQDKLDDCKKKLTPIKDGKIPFVADSYLALVAVNLCGSDFKPYVAMLSQFEVEPLLDAVNGLATLTVTGFDVQNKKPAFTFTAQANDIKCLDGLMKRLGDYGLPVKDEGHHNWTIADVKGDNLLVGAQGGFVFANYGNGMKRPKGENTVELEDGTVAYMRAFPARIQEFAHYDVKEIEFYATDEMTTQTTITLCKTWRELIDQK